MKCLHLLLFCSLDSHAELPMQWDVFPAAGQKAIGKNWIFLFKAGTCLLLGIRPASMEKQHPSEV